MKMKVAPSLLGSLLILVLSHSQLRAEAVVATSGKVSGTAEVITPSGKSTKLTPDSEIPTGSSIHTDANSTVGLKLVPGATTVVASDTDMKLSTIDYSQDSNGDKTRNVNLTLEKGTLFASLVKHDGNSNFRITTPLGVAAARGTDLKVIYYPGKPMTTCCLDGVVILTLSGGKTVIVSAGMVAVSFDGRTILRNLTPQEIRAIIAAIEAAGFSPAGGSGHGSNGGGTTGGGSDNNNGQSSNPGNISGQPTVSGNR